MTSAEDLNIRVPGQYREIVEEWKARVARNLGLPDITWGQLLAAYANSKVMP